MTETFRTGLAALPTVTLTRRRDVMGHPTVRESRHERVRALRVAGAPRGGYLVTGPDGAEIGVLVCAELGRHPQFVALPKEGRGPPLAQAGRHAAAGSLAFVVVERSLRAARAEARREALAQRAADRRHLDPFDRDAINGLQTQPV